MEGGAVVEEVEVHTTLHPNLKRDWYFIAEQPAPAPHPAHPEGCAALHIVLVTVPRGSRSCEHLPDGFDLHLLHPHPQPYALIPEPNTIHPQTRSTPGPESRSLSFLLLSSLELSDTKVYEP